MFERIVRAAEAAASNVGQSRRGFLGLLGRGAVAAAGVLGGFLLSAREVGADPSGGVVCCVYQCFRVRRGYRYSYRSKKTCQPAGTTCAQSDNGCYLVAQSTAAACGQC
jgi:hypothetical protein